MSSSCVIQKLKDNRLYRVVDIQCDILHDHSVKLSYKQVWLGKEVTRGVLHGSEVANYDLLMWYTS